MGETYKSVDEYIQSFPKEVQEILEQVRKTIMQAAPNATESISYAMPAYKTNGKHWYILRHLIITSAFMPRPPDIRNLLMNFLNTNKVKDQYSFL